MSMLLCCVSRSLLLLLALAFLPAPAAARSAGAEASCVGAKLRATATQCQSVLQAWGRLERDGQRSRFARSLRNAAKHMRQRWSIANRHATRQDVECRDMSLAGGDMASLLQDRAGDLAESLAGDGACSECCHQCCGRPKRAWELSRAEEL